MLKHSAAAYRLSIFDWHRFASPAKIVICKVIKKKVVGERPWEIRTGAARTVVYTIESGPKMKIRNTTRAVFLCRH